VNSLPSQSEEIFFKGLLDVDQGALAGAVSVVLEGAD
jgi:hypothetical protein